MPITRSDSPVDEAISVPLKVSKETHRRVKHGALLYGETQQQFMDRAVREYFRMKASEVGQLVAEIEGATADD